MLTPSGVTAQAYIDAIKNDNQQHVRVTFTNGNIVFQDSDIDLNTGIELTDYLNAETDLTFGKAVCSTINIPFIRSLKTDTLNWTAKNEIKVEFGVEISGTTRWVTVGYFRPTMPDRLVTDIINIVAYDRMQLFEVAAEPFLNSITYPTTLASIYNKLCAYVGITKVSGDELSANLNRTISLNPFSAQNGATCRDILAAIAEAVGCYAKVNSDGNVTMVWFRNHNNDYSLLRDYIYNLEVGDIAWNLAKRWGDVSPYVWGDLAQYTWGDMESVQFTAKRWDELASYTWGQMASYTWGDMQHGKYDISAVRIVQTKDDIGITYPTGAYDRNVYLIVDNPFLYGATADESRQNIIPIYERVHAFGAYIPATVESKGNWLIEAGDIITLEVSNENLMPFPVFNRTIRWNGHCNCTYETTGNLERAETSGDIKQKLTNGGQLHEIVVDVEKTYEKIQNQFGEYYTKTETATYVSTEMADKLGNYYTKTETASYVSTQMSDALGNYYTKMETASYVSTQMTNALGDYYTKTETASYVSTTIGNKLGDYYTKTETASYVSTTMSSALGDYYTKTETASYVSTTMSSKLGDYYTKTETASLISTTMSDSLGNYYTKTETASYVSRQMSDSLGNYYTKDQTASYISTRLSDYYGKVTNITITTSGVEITNTSSSATGKWLFYYGGARYTKDNQYTMGIGDTSNINTTNGGVFFNSIQRGGEIQFIARDSQKLYTPIVSLKCVYNNTTGSYSASFYQTGTNATGAVTLGTYDIPWHKAYITTRYGYYGSMCFQPYEGHECKMYCDYNSSRLMLYPVVTPGNISSLGTNDNRWTSLYVGTIYANSISGLTPASIGAVPTTSTSNVAIKVGSYTLQMQVDGNLVIYDSSMNTVWHAL